MRLFWVCCACPLFALLGSVAADDLPLVSGVEAQPLKAQAKRVAEALKFLGEPLGQSRQQALDDAIQEADEAKAVLKIQEALDPLCLAGVNINPESRVKVKTGPAAKVLDEQGWRVFLIKVHNQAGITAKIRAFSPNAGPLQKTSTSAKNPPNEISQQDVADRWLDLETFDQQPLQPELSGLGLEYRIVQLFCRDAGEREATLAFDVGQGTQDLGFRNEIAVLFECRPSNQVELRVVDTDGQPTTGQFVFRDPVGRVYPTLSRRLAPDLFFHDQIYRASGESVTLPAGKYDVMFTRGPEYVIEHRPLEVTNEEGQIAAFQLRRWIKLADHGWYSGDHHVHAAGCAHYESPTQGITPQDMMRHIVGEDLNVGCVLSWGPCWYYQKDFFDGQVSELSTKNHLMRYDVEVSGFPSSHAGHLCLLNLKEDDYRYPSDAGFDWNFEGESGRFEGQDTKLIGQWPSWTLPVLQWGKQQGGVVGFSHSGWGLQVEGDHLPNYNMPAFDGIGANEYIVDVAHGACDFISAVDTPAIWELNIWYHTLNSGFTCRISGETDFPCIYGERVGLGRAYVKLDKDEPFNYENWIRGIRDGRSYCSDGLSHLFDFRIGELGVGEMGDGDRASFLAVTKNQKLNLRVNAAALLADKPRDDIRARPMDEQPYWHVERARIGQTLQVPVELIVNGRVEARKEIDADGSIHPLSFEYTPTMSSWIAVRILPAAHTNPIFVEVDGKPIRPSKKSAQWCLDAVDVCWRAKQGQYREFDKPAAEAAYELARLAYREILAAAHDDTRD